MMMRHAPALQLLWRIGDKPGEGIVDGCSPFTWDKPMFDASLGLDQKTSSSQVYWRPAELEHMDFDSRCVGGVRLMGACL
jgi:hypothetical protein